MEQNDIIKQAIKNELKQINNLPLELSIKYDYELKELTEKYDNEKNLYLKSFYRTSINYISLEIDKLDDMELKDYLIKDNIFKAIKGLLKGKIIILDDWYLRQNTYKKGLELVGNDIIKHLLVGFKLISIFENDTYLADKNDSKEGGKKAAKNILQKASDKTSNYITKELLKNEITEIDKYNFITNELLLKSIFYQISKSLILFKKYDNEKVEKITNEIIKEVYKPKRFKSKITDKEQFIKYNKHSFAIYQ